MSGPIRKLIGPAKFRLLRYIETANGLMEKRPVETLLDEEESEAEDFANRISTTITLLEKCNDDWSNILKELKDDAKVTEEREYARVTEGEDGLIETLSNGKEVLSRLKVRITIILRKREQIALQATRTVIQENLSLQAPSFQPPENVSSNNIESSVRLPKLQLPNFDGNVLRWPEFWDIYESSVHRVTRYSKGSEVQLFKVQLFKVTKYS